jgi:hypothetical protein
MQAGSLRSFYLLLEREQPCSLLQGTRAALLAIMQAGSLRSFQAYNNLALLNSQSSARSTNPALTGLL